MSDQDLPLAVRDQIVRDFRDCKINFFITTNVLSRGFDDPNIYLVVNFESLPKFSVPEIPEFLKHQERKPFKIHQLFTQGNIATLKKSPKTTNLFQGTSFELNELSIKKQLLTSDLNDPKVYETYKFILERPGIAVDTYVYRAGREGLCLTFVSNKYLDNYEENQM